VPRRKEGKPDQTPGQELSSRRNTNAAERNKRQSLKERDKKNEELSEKGSVKLRFKHP